MRLLMLNRVIALLIFCEFLLTTSIGFVIPIYSVFVVEEIQGGTIQTVGFSLAVYWIVKSILQIPVARWLDRREGEIDDYWAMVFGIAASGIGAIAFYFLVSSIWHLYLFQFYWGVTDAFLVPPFYAIFSRHLDKGHEGFEWAVHSSLSFGAGSAAGGALGGILAGMFGLRSVFLYTGCGMLLGIIVLLCLYHHIKPAGRKTPRVFIERKRL